MPTVSKITLRLGDEAYHLFDKLTVPTEREFKGTTGQMIAPATLARVGIMNYRAGDIKDAEGNLMFPDRDVNDMVKVMTTEAALFDEKTLESARSAPITIGHPRDALGNLIDIDPSNANVLQKGFLEGMPSRLGDDLTGIVVLNDKETITLVQEEADELSIGQTCDLILADESVDWDLEKVNIRINHIAIVRKGRAETAKINDSVSMYDQDHVDGLQATIDTLSGSVTSLKAKLADAEAAVILAKDVAFGDAVEARMDLIVSAKKLLPTLESKGKVDIEIKREAAESFYQGSGKLADESDAYVEVLFDMALADNKEDSGVSDLQAVLNDESAASVKPSVKPTQSPQELARQRSIARHAHKEP